LGGRWATGWLKKVPKGVFKDKYKYIYKNQNKQNKTKQNKAKQIKSKF
jgi:hypothetical protein